MKRGKFSLSHYKLLSLNMGELVPVSLVEVLPGDTVQQATTALLRAAPLLAPVMHPCHARIHHWFVPHRLIWDDFEDFITAGPDGEDDSVFPTITMPGGGGAALGSLADYLGVPTGINSLEVSALPFRGYAMIWNEWYRDQDLQTELTIDTTSGPDTTTNTTLQNVGWEKDYFTSARPWESKGPEITISIGDEAPVVFPTTPQLSQVIAAERYTGAGAPENLGNLRTAGGGSYDITTTTPAASASGDLVLRGSVPAPTDAYADLSAASPVSINTLREAFALQRYQEARARFGSRYVEYLRYLGVRSSDARLQRPEYLGGGSQTIQFSEVLQTAEGTDPVGQLRGHGIGSVRSNRYRRYFEEHGYVFSCISVRPKTIYAQGLFRHWNRRTKEDFWQLELQHIGQQAVLNKEVYAAHASPNNTFGFQDRYDEYRRTESSVAGEFRTSVLDYWHLARIFSSSPALNATFVSSVPTKRVFAAQENDVLYAMVRHSIQARRNVAQTGKSFIY